MLTVAILNYNGADTLEESIKSVSAQTRKPDRFVVIDNASTDGSWKIAEDYGVEVVFADNEFKFITGLNTAINLNAGFLFFMQNDVILDKNCLEFMMQDCPSDHFIAQPVIYQTDGDIDNAGMDIYWPGYGERRHNRWWGDFDYQNCGLVTTICFLTDNKSVYYDELFYPAYYEDLDFAMRTRPYMKHVLIPSASAIHKGNHTFSQTMKVSQIKTVCYLNRLKFVRKHYTGLDRGLRVLAIRVIRFGSNLLAVLRSISKKDSA
jgi:GT2 family glycosyltransferase